MSLLDLIHDYSAVTRAVAAQLRFELGAIDLLDGWRQKRIPQRGTLRDGSKYQFHGIGCWVGRAEGVEVDFDFGPEGRDDGFDGWRLWRFARQSPAKYPDFQRRETVEAALRSLVAAGAIGPSGFEHDHLLYLRH